MLLERYYDDTLAQASYLIACEKTREAIVIDPTIDAEQYLAAATTRRMRIRYVTETHIHADFLSGSRELARAGKAKLLLSGHGDDTWRYGFAENEGARLLRDGDSITVGNVRLDVMHTPGHTPEHISFVVTDTAVADRPMGIVTGDFLFVGDVGRPDLLERAANVAGSMEQAARQLYASLRRLTGFPDYAQIWPGHGAGSACGKALGAVPQSTLGYERLFNPALQHKSEDAFVRWVLADQPEPPPYFAVMKLWNRDGAPERRKAEGHSWMDASAVLAAIKEGSQVVDVRSTADFAREHIPGTINIPASTSAATYAGTVLSYDRPIVLISHEQGQTFNTRHQLELIGLEISGYAKPDVIEEIKRGGHRMESIGLVDPQSLASRRNGVRVIDVRGQSEWNHGHLPQATHIYLGDLLERTADMKRDEPIVVHCQSGNRSSIAASLLKAHGFADVTTLAGGFDAWRKAGLPVADE
jgi:hydroxyacylglutathione hydrolase